MKPALIVVDIQKDFLPDGALPVPDGDLIVPVVNKLMSSGKYETIVATQDSHPFSHGSFASNHKGVAPFSIFKLDGLDQVAWPVHCVAGTPGCEWADGLDYDLFDRVIPKGTNIDVDSYSGFWDNGKRKRTQLDKYLKSLKIQEVHVVGLALDYCVKYTAIDAHQLGYKTSVILEATKSIGDSQETVRELLNQKIYVI